MVLLPSNYEGIKEEENEVWVRPCTVRICVHYCTKQFNSTVLVSLLNGSCTMRVLTSWTVCSTNLPSLYQI